MAFLSTEMSLQPPPAQDTVDDSVPSTGAQTTCFREVHDILIHQVRADGDIYDRALVVAETDLIDQRLGGTTDMSLPRKVVTITTAGKHGWRTKRHHPSRRRSFQISNRSLRFAVTGRARGCGTVKVTDTDVDEEPGPTTLKALSKIVPHTVPASSWECTLYKELKCFVKGEGSTAATRASTGSCILSNILAADATYCRA